ncbi:Nucleolar protein 12 [Elasticomyces elasticus]|nr:Nucleolar protein 12 [Elasticomyces elasticus]
MPKKDKNHVETVKNTREKSKKSKTSKREKAAVADITEQKNGLRFPLLAQNDAVDATLASLFAVPSKPRKPAKVQSDGARRAKTTPDDQNTKSLEADADGQSEDSQDSDADNDVELSEIDEEGVDADEQSPLETDDGIHNLEVTQHKRKRKRKDDGDLEDAYMQRLAREEAREDAKAEAERSTKRQKKAEPDSSEEDSDAGKDASPRVEDDDTSPISAASPPPQHESLAPASASDFEKSARTVFVGNVSTSAITSKSALQTLKTHLTSCCASLPADKGTAHKIESLRFRSTAFASSIPKKAAFAKKELMDATTKSTNAYVVYTTVSAAREAVKSLNATVVLDRHLRVDSVAHPAKTDHKRCVFVGNLGFVDDESNIDAADAEEGNRRPRAKVPADVEEGLWRTFGKCGTVESVRVVRDPKTRVGKGFAYVQFAVGLPSSRKPRTSEQIITTRANPMQDENAVEAALLYTDKKFPPLLPRKLRVMRAKSIKRNTKPSSSTTRPPAYSKPNGIYNPKTSARQQSQLGRADKLLGKAGGAQLRNPGRDANAVPRGVGRRGVGSDGGSGEGLRRPEEFVFEGHRASSRQGKSGLKLGGSGKKKGKPRTRSSRRGAEWKAGGGEGKKGK